MAETQDKDEAARTCLRVGVPHFYEVDSSDPMTPRQVWEVQSSGDSYILKSESWKELVENTIDKLFSILNKPLLGFFISEQQ